MLGWASSTGASMEDCSQCAAPFVYNATSDQAQSVTRNQARVKRARRSSLSLSLSLSKRLSGLRQLGPLGLTNPAKPSKTVS